MLRCEARCFVRGFQRQQLAWRRAAELGRQQAQLADLVLGKLLIFTRRRLGQVSDRVRHHRLLGKQQRKGQQQVDQCAFGGHRFSGCAKISGCSSQSSPDAVQFQSRASDLVSRQ